MTKTTMRLWHAGLLLSAALLGGCATVPELNTSYSGADAGQVVASINNNATAYSNMELRLRAVPGTGDRQKDPVGRLQYRMGMFTSTEPEVWEGRAHGVVAVASLPPGRYEIFNYEMVQTGLVEITVRSREPLSIPFEVRAGQTVYLGAYEVSLRRNRLGLPDPFLPVIRIRDRFDRDMRVATQKGAKEANAVNATPPISEIGAR